MADDLGGEHVDLDERVLGEVDVETGRQVDGGVEADNEIQSKGKAGLNVEQAGDVQRQLAGGDKLGGLKDLGVGLDIELDVGLDTAQVDGDRGLEDEVGVQLDIDVTRDVGVGKAEVELDVGQTVLSRGSQTARVRILNILNIGCVSMIFLMIKKMVLL